DEPTAALDAGSGRAAMLMLRRIAVKPGRAVVVVTHDDRILPFADRIAHLSDGRVTHVEKLSRQEVA
ncbi:MAG TPA: ABC transporter ATP-binding protein, partial [Hyphomicrobiaceae bacterium]|nr:ABC transporter ATP-binding protein [Hyphomicrobiaceae bacterium]